MLSPYLEVLGVRVACWFRAVTRSQDWHPLTDATGVGFRSQRVLVSRTISILFGMKTINVKKVISSIMDIRV